MGLRKYRSPGEMLPTGYGVAWHSIECQQDVCYPLGLNRLVNWLRRFHLWLAKPPQDALMQRDRRAWNDGYARGKKVGLEAGYLKSVADELEKNGKATITEGTPLRTDHPGRPRDS